MLEKARLALDDKFLSLLVLTYSLLIRLPRRAVREISDELLGQGRSLGTPIRPRGNDCYLRVYDLSYTENESQRLVGASNDRTTLKTDLDSLPEQDKLFRVYLVEGSPMDDSTLLDHLHSRGFPTGHQPSNRTSNAFEALASQWRHSNTMSYESTMYSSEQVRRMGSTASVPPLIRQVSGGLAFLAGLISMNMSIQIRDITGTKDKSISMILRLNLLA
jgi:hypothetical protein